MEWATIRIRGNAFVVAFSLAMMLYGVISAALDLMAWVAA